MKSISDCLQIIPLCLPQAKIKEGVIVRYILGKGCQSFHSVGYPQIYLFREPTLAFFLITTPVTLRVTGGCLNELGEEATSADVDDVAIGVEE